MAAPVVAAVGSNSKSAGSTSHAATMPAGIASGDLLVASVGFRSSSATLTGPTGWTKLGQQQQSGQGVLGAFWRIADGTEGASQTFTSSASAASTAAVLRITGNDGTTPFDTSLFQPDTVANASVTHTGITTTGTDRLVVFSGYCGSAVMSPFTPPSGWTQHADVKDITGNTALFVSTVEQPTAGATGTTITTGSSPNPTAATFMGAVTPSAGGGTPDPGLEVTVRKDATDRPVTALRRDGVNYTTDMRRDGESTPFVFAPVAGPVAVTWQWSGGDQ